MTFADTSTGTITNRAWIFGDGATLSTNGATVIHTYTTPGSNTVGLTVAGAAGTNRSALTNCIVLTNRPPLLVVSPTNLDFGLIPAGLTSTQVFWVANPGGTVLNGVATSPPPFSVVGGSPFSVTPGATSAVQVAFSPAEAGPFSAAVIFSGNGGSLTNLVSGGGVLPPSPSFQAQPALGAAPLDVVFTDTSTGTILSRVWDFGDGSTLTTQDTNVTHRYAVAATNTVTLTTVGPFASPSLVSVGCVIVTNALLPGFLVVSPAVLDFGAILRGATGQASFVVSNAGGAPLEVTATLNDGPFDFLPDDATKLLLHLDGTNGSAFWPDASASPKLVTPNGGVRVDTAQSRFGGGSGLFDGLDGYLSAPASADWNFGSGDFTIDAWVRFDGLPALGAFQTLVAQADGANHASFSLNNAAGQLQWWLSCSNAPATVFDMAFNTTVVTDAWYHVAMVRQSNTWSCYQDGLRVGQEADDLDSFPELGLPLLIGSSWNDGFLDGSLDEVRISKGLARWTAEFIPPALPYSDQVTFTLLPQSNLTLPIRFRAADQGSVSNQVVFVSQGGSSTQALVAQATLPPPLVMLAPVYAGGAFSVGVPTVSGTRYWLEFKNSFGETNWTPLPAVSGDGTIQLLWDATPPGPQRFYHVRQQ